MYFEEKPSSPTGPLSTKDITEDSVTLSWQPPASDGGTAVTGYLLEKYDNRRRSWVKVADLDVKTTSFVVPKLIEGEKYKFRVSAVSAEGQGLPLETEEDVVPRKPACTYHSNLLFLVIESQYHVLWVFLNLAYMTFHYFERLFHFNCIR